MSRRKLKPDQKITSLDELMKVLKNDPSIYVTAWGQAWTTAFFRSWQIWMCNNFIERGYFYTVKKARKNIDKIVKKS